jgi:hypothetical protein
MNNGYLKLSEKDGEKKRNAEFYLGKYGFTINNYKLITN